MLHINDVEWRGEHLLQLSFDNGVDKVVERGKGDESNFCRKLRGMEKLRLHLMPLER